MRIIKIDQLPNGAHENQTWGLTPIPDGYVAVPADLKTPNFPFGNIEVTDGIVTKWEPLPIPQTEPEPEPQPTMEARLASLERKVQNLELTSGGSVIDPNTPPVDNPPDKPLKPTPGGGLTIGG